jgi:hypothetical protein
VDKGDHRPNANSLQCARAATPGQSGEEGRDKGMKC